MWVEIENQKGNKSDKFGFVGMMIYEIRRYFQTFEREKFARKKENIGRMQCLWWKWNNSMDFIGMISDY